MELDDLVKRLMKREMGRELLKGIKSCTPEHPIIYLDDYKDLQEYRVLELFAEKGVLEETKKYFFSTFVLTPKGKNYFDHRGKNVL